MYQLRVLILGLMIGFTHAVWAAPKMVTIKKETKQFILDVQYPQGFNQGHIDQTVKSFITKTRNAQDLTASDPLTASLPGKNGLTIRYKIAFQNEHAVSLLFDVSTYSKGAAHPNNTVKTFNFIDGKPVMLTDLFKPKTDYLTQIANYCRTKLLKIENVDEKWINEGTQATAKNYRNWNFNQQGLAIIFDTYQVAAYVYGPQTIIIPHTSISPLLRSEIQQAVWGNA